MPPPAKPRPSHRLSLTTNSLKNTTLSVEDDTIFYEIVTRFWHPHLTKINKTNMETREVYTVAEIEREPGKEARVRFDGDKGQWMSAAQFVQYDPERAYVCSIVIIPVVSFDADMTMLGVVAERS